jgi:hypothetical protein
MPIRVERESAIGRATDDRRRLRDPPGRLERTFDARGCARAHRLTSGRCDGCSMNDSPQKPLREGGYRPIGGAFRAGVREDEPQRLRRFAHASVVEWPRAVSGRLTPAARS